MTFDANLLFAFLLVFVRCSAMLISSPLFGAQNTPVQVRTLTTLAIAGALTLVLKPKMGEMPQDMYTLAAAVLAEVVAGIVLGLTMTLVLQAAQIAGSILDLQLGLGLSQTLNPISGVPVSVITQFKMMLATAVYLSMDGHHLMLSAFAQSYTIAPTLSLALLPALQESFVSLISGVFVLAIQIAAPVLAVTLVVDASLGFINKAVPQMQAMLVGTPAKTALGMVTIAVALPTFTGAIANGVEYAAHSMGRFFGY
jgi:flagellar biosynthetic protein FliR